MNDQVTKSDDGGEAAVSPFAERIAGQQAIVDDLQKEFEKKPSPEIELQINRKRDTVLHLKNLAKGDPRARAKAAAEVAKAAVLSKAITRPLR
jgi:hypothetical protein